jgi:LPXTG-site transpeptidase (sortase) family protein
VTAPVTGGRHREFGGRHRARRRPASIAVRLAAGAVIAVAGVLAATMPSSAPAAPSPTASDIPVPVSVVRGDAEPADAAPMRVRVPAIGVDSDLVRLGVDEDRALVPPSDFATAGWFAGGPAPGETGPAVIAGHVDSYRGPAVFFRLTELELGDEVLVDRDDGTMARFRVTAVDRYPKDEFPTEQVYGPTPHAELRLITCGGEFDRDVRSYQDNVVVSAVHAG